MHLCMFFMYMLKLWKQIACMIWFLWWWMNHKAQAEWRLTCFCLSGPQSCIHGCVGGCLMRGRSGCHSDTTGTGPELLPTSPTGFHPSPGSQENTKCIHYWKDAKITLKFESQGLTIEYLFYKHYVNLAGPIEMVIIHPSIGLEFVFQWILNQATTLQWTRLLGLQQLFFIID